MVSYPVRYYHKVRVLRVTYSNNVYNDSTGDVLKSEIRRRKAHSLLLTSVIPALSATGLATRQLPQNRKDLQSMTCCSCEKVRHWIYGCLSRLVRTVLENFSIFRKFGLEGFMIFEHCLSHIYIRSVIKI